VRNQFAETFYQLGCADPRLCIVVADISPAGSIQKFREAFPQRFVNTGVAEQVMIGVAAGMALRGLRPFAYTIATFALYRPFEMIRDDLAYHNLPVTVVGIGGGLAYSTLGGTHHAQEDIGLACTVPGMSVLAPCDPAETADATRYCAGNDGGPVYLRLGKAGEPILTADAAEPFRFGKLRYLRRGQDVCVLSYGTAMKIALDVADDLARQGRSVSVASVHTLKPLDREGLADVLHRHARVVVIEEASPQNGLGAQTKQIAWDTRATCDLQAFALKDAFIHVYGSHDEILSAHGLDTKTILAALAAAGPVTR
jgi:transketolase